MHRFWLWLATALLLSGVSPGVLSAQEKASETDVKAAFLYNFAKFVEWPGSSNNQLDSTFRIGVAGKTAMNKAIKIAVESKQVAGRQVEVLESDDAKVLAGCHIVFFNSSSQPAMEAMLTTLRGHPVLTVSEHEEFISHGGMIRFFVANGKVRFEISPARARAEKLNISSKLLKLAVIADSYGGAE